MSAVATRVVDERLAKTGPIGRAMRRPEVGSAVAALLVFTFFSLYTDQFLSDGGISTWMNSSSRMGIAAVFVALLMIGGEFDLSTGTMVGTTGLAVGIMTTRYEVNVFVAVLLALLLALAIGALNGVVVMKTELPSFIVTLGTFFVLQGCNIALTKALTNQSAIQGMLAVPHYDSIRPIFGGTFSVGPIDFNASVMWWLGTTVVATWILLRTRAGNWIFAVGGEQRSARQVGVPVMVTKVGLFMGTAVGGWVVGMCSLFLSNTANGTTGVGDEFIFIICAVVGGCLLTGGFGSAIGATFGALIYGMTQLGITYAGWDSDWLKAFLGVMLLGAVLVNNWIRMRAERAR